MGEFGREEASNRVVFVWLFNLLPLSCFAGYYGPFLIQSRPASDAFIGRAVQNIVRTDPHTH
jgi:hypothetical protein